MLLPDALGFMALGLLGFRGEPRSGRPLLERGERADARGWSFRLPALEGGRDAGCKAPADVEPAMEGGPVTSEGASLAARGSTDPKSADRECISRQAI